MLESGPAKTLRKVDLIRARARNEPEFTA